MREGIVGLERFQKLLEREERRGLEVESSGESPMKPVKRRKRSAKALEHRARRHVMLLDLPRRSGATKVFWARQRISGLGTRHR